MSQKIDDVLKVLATIRKSYSADLPGSLRDARIRAIHTIAGERSVTYQTIGDAYLRRLEPDIKGTPHFDRVTENWLSGRSDSIKIILEKHALDYGDRARIHRFFA